MSRMHLLENSAEDKISKKVLQRRIEALEAKIEALERSKSEDHTHTISTETILSIAALVEADIVRKLQQLAPPPEPAPAEEQPTPQEEPAS